MMYQEHVTLTNVEVEQLSVVIECSNSMDIYIE
jgi:hypothetical protein